MTFRSDLSAAAKADAGISALAGRRVYWRVRPQGSPVPALVLTLIPTALDYTLTGPNALVERVVQLDGYATSADDADALEVAILTFLDTLRAAPFQGAFVQRFDDAGEPDTAPQPDGATDFYRASIDARIWHRPNP